MIKDNFNRIAIISSPRSGNTWVRSVISDALSMPCIAVHNYKDIEEPLPERCFLQLHWYKEPNFQLWLKEHHFKILCVARNPLDIFLSVLHFIRYENETHKWLGGNVGISPELVSATPNSEVFLHYCLSPGAEHLLSVSYQWWQDEYTFKLRYEDCVANPVSVLGSQVALFGGKASAVESSLENWNLKKMQALPNRHGWQGQPGLYKKLIPPHHAFKIYKKHKNVFAHMGYKLSPYFLSYREASANWDSLL